MINFRTLFPSEIETRAARCTEKGAQLLLYKDARCDMAILDETVGAKNWQRRHDEHNGNLFCSVGINCGGTWIWKEDAGAESNTEAEKGHASDSFKRACVNWGIGRELYTAPFIWIPGVTTQKNGKWVCNGKFYVSGIEYDEGRRIVALTIADKDGVVAYKMGQPVKKTQQDLFFRCEECGAKLTVYKDANGKDVSIRKHAEGTKAKFGKTLCLDCVVKVKAHENDVR